MFSQDKKKILLVIANALETNEELIKVENDAHVKVAQLARYEKSLVSRLVLKPGKISSLANSICVLANMEEPIDHVLKRTKVADGLILEKMPCPLDGYISNPKWNRLLLKSGKEAKRSNAILHKVITEAILDSVGKKLIGLVTSREEIPDLLKLDDVIDLIIPRDNNSLVFQIKDSIKILVLDHARRECFTVWMRMAGGFWMRGGEAPSAVKREDQIIENQEDLWSCLTVIFGGVLMKVVRTVTDYYSKSAIS
uniref:GRPD C-terminal domain-containing protein n=1 Tax=Vitis vinifera TaxID=29760 RepID=F6I5G2_VITVI